MPNTAQLDIEGKRRYINVLLDSGASCFLLSEKLVEQLDIPFKVQRKPIKIGGFDGLSSSSGGQRYTRPIILEIGNGHRSIISAEIAPTGHFDLIIPFRWWYHEQHMSDIDEPKKWSFGQMTCHDHVEHEAVQDLFEYDETVAYNPKAQYVGRIGRREEPPWGPVYPMSQYQLNTLKTYLDEMLAQGKITHSQCNNPTLMWLFMRQVTNYLLRFCQTILIVRASS